VGEYYRAIDSRPYIKDVAVPLLCVQSSDDPLFTEGGVLTRDVLPVEDIYDNEKAIYFETELGSHLSFVEAEIPGGVTRHEHTFIDRVVEAYLTYAEVKAKVHEY
jgi:predicted alpha/beta-fold hydrolase